MNNKGLYLAVVTSLAMGMVSIMPSAYATDANNDPNTLSCKLDFTLSGWSALYKTANGQGTVKCSNGKSMDVFLDANGGGLTFGNYKIQDGKGDFTGVTDIHQVLGSYAMASAHIGAVKSVHAAVMTKDDVTLTLTGQGNGWDIGVGFSGFTISAAQNDANN